MELTYECLGCHAVVSVQNVGPGGEAGCPTCGTTRPIRAGAVDDQGLLACPLCATDDLYLQKDFPQGLGLAIVVAGFAISTIFWYLDRPVPALGVLLISALTDMVLYYTVPNVTICYRCLSQYRGRGSSPSDRFHPFDLAVGERYRQERLRIEDLKRQTATADATTPVTPPGV